MADDDAKRVQDKFIKALTDAGNTAKQAEERVKAFMPKIKGSEKEFLNLIEAEKALQSAAGDNDIKAAAIALKKRDEVKKTLKDKLEKNKIKADDIKEVLLYGEVLGTVEAEKSKKKDVSSNVDSGANFTSILTALKSGGEALAIAPGISIPQLLGKNNRIG